VGGSEVGNSEVGDSEVGDSKVSTSKVWAFSIYIKITLIYINWERQRGWRQGGQAFAEIGESNSSNS
jgi:hypothetical protein